MLTIFTVPKAFTGRMEVIQRNAILSWKRLCPAPEIILAGDDFGTEQVARELDLVHIAPIERNEYGTPLLSDVFAKAHQVACYPVLGFVNADMVLLGDFMEAVQRVISLKKRFLMTGRRINVEMEGPLDFGERWEERLRDVVMTRGRRYTAMGMDYFVFPKGLWPRIPQFAAGWSRNDNWLVYDAFSKRIPVIDATPSVTAVHQNHDYSFKSGFKADSLVWEGPEARRNLALAGGWPHIFSLRDATHELSGGRLNFIVSGKRLKRYLQTLPALIFGHGDLILLDLCRKPVDSMRKYFSRSGRAG